MIYDMNTITNVQTQKNKIIFFIDWDNTIMPSYALLNNISGINIKKQLADLENIVINLLSSAQQKGKVFIITNADTEWLMSSSQTFFPKLNLMMKDTKIILISAKSKYKKVFPEDNFKWKYETFRSCLDEESNYQNDITHVISIADGNLEEKILQSLVNEIMKTNMKKYYIKTIILVSNPSIHQINKQLTLIIEKLDFIIEIEDNIGIKMTSKKNI